MIYGYFSRKAAEKFGATFWKTPSGGEVEVTNVGGSERPIDSGYLWDDAECIGEVTEWARGSMKILKRWKD